MLSVIELVTDGVASTEGSDAGILGISTVGSDVTPLGKLCRGERRTLA